MTYFIMPNWLFYIFATLIAHGVFWLFFIIGAGIYLHVKEKKEKEEEEKAFFTPVECKDKDELIRMDTFYPGKYTPDALLMISGACEGMLDVCRYHEDEYLSKIYDRMETELTEAQEKRLLERLTEARGVIGFISYMEEHGINAYLTYLQNGEIFFEDKPHE